MIVIGLQFGPGRKSTSLAATTPAAYERRPGSAKYSSMRGRVLAWAAHLVTSSVGARLVRCLALPISATFLASSGTVSTPEAPSSSVDHAGGPGRQ